MEEKLLSFAILVIFLIAVPLLVWFSFRHERAFQRELAQRKSQTSEEFVAFYPTAAERSIALRLLPILPAFLALRPENFARRTARRRSSISIPWN